MELHIVERNFTLRTQTAVTMAERTTPNSHGSSQQGILLGEEEPEEVREDKSLSQKIYETLGYSKKVLVTLCLGLKAAGDNTSRPLIDLECSPWSSETKQGIKPSNNDLAVEVQRRQKVLIQPPKSTDKSNDKSNDKNNDKSADKSSEKLFLMKPKNKKREALLEWLDAFPISDPNCLLFLTSEAERVADVLQRAIDEEKETSIALKHGAWSGQIPFLRLVHCITDCDVTRHAFLHRNDVME
jgi:hypothetical protein